jgi:Ala-tRNA(Pro) deacylase
MTMTRTSLTAQLDRDHVSAYELLRHRHTETAAEEAIALGAKDAEVGKTVVLVGSHGFVRVVVPSGSRLDLLKLRPLVGCGPMIRLATEAELSSAYPMFELGAVPPFGGPSGDVVIVDRRLALQDTIIIEAGTHDESIRIPVPDLLRIASAQVAEVCRS